MTRWIGLLGFILFAASVALAGYTISLSRHSEFASQNIEDPETLIVKSEVVDLGDISQNEEYQAEFHLTNPTQGAIQILVIGKSCSCSEPEIDSKELSPGQSTTMRVRFKTQMRMGPTAVNLSIRYQIGEPAIVKDRIVVIRSNIKPEIELSSPAFVFWDNEVMTTVTLSAGTKPLPTIKAVTCSNPDVHLVLIGSTITAFRKKPNEEMEQETVLVETDQPIANWLRIPMKSQLRASDLSNQ